MNARCLTLVGRAGVTMALLAAPTSCSKKKDEPPHAPDAATAEARMGDAPSDPDELLECDVAEQCSSGLADQRPFTITPPHTACKLEGLEERKPARWVNGSSTHTSTRTKYVNVTSVDPEAIERATRLCTMRDTRYFSACVDAVLAVRPLEPSAGRAWDCAYGEGPEQPSELDWFESCDAASEACE